MNSLRSKAHGLEPVLHVGKGGITPGLLNQLDRELTAKKLIKVRLRASALPADPSRADRRALAEELAAGTHSEVVDLVGNVAVLHRR